VIGSKFEVVVPFDRGDFDAGQARPDRAAAYPGQTASGILA